MVKKSIPHRLLSTRAQVIREATIDAHDWALQSEMDVSRDLHDRAEGRSVSSAALAAALRQYDSAMLESPASFAGVPARWRGLYDSTLERVYRADIRARVAEILGEKRAPARANPSGDLWNVRFVHKISSRAGDVTHDVFVPSNAWSNSKTLGAALRNAGVLTSGVRVRSFRTEGDKVVVFPSRSVWHSVILTHAESRPNPSWGDVRSAASRAHAAGSRAYARAKPHAKRAAASVRSAAERGYAYAKPRVKAGTRRVLSGISTLSARGAKALENPAANVTVWEVLYDGPGAGPAGDGTHIARFRSEKQATAFARGKTAYRSHPAKPEKVSVPRRLAERWGLV